MSLPLFSRQRFYSILFCLFLLWVCLFAKERLEKKKISLSHHLSTISREQASLELESTERLNLGFKTLVSGLLWVQLLQDSNTSSIPQDALSWEFTRLNAITSLDPNFSIAFSYGAIFLSVFKRDRLGAKIILEKWIRQQPNYWRAEYLLGYHLYYELGMLKEGSKHLLKAASLPGSPAWLTSLGIRLVSATGSLAQALRMTCDLFPIVHSTEGKYRLTKRVRSINYALQKASWEEALVNYRSQSHKEPQQIQDLKPLLKNQLREISSLFTSETDEELVPLLKETFRFRYDRQSRSIQSISNLHDIDIDITGIHIPKEK